MTNRQIDKYILVGLGNPGEKYERTRHNAGKMFVRWLKEEGKGLRLDPRPRGEKEKGHTKERFEAIESESFMNESGQCVARWLTQKGKGKRKKEKGQTGLNSLLPLIVVHDDLDIPFGRFKIQFGKGPKQHNGILSVEQTLGTKGFWRIRVGIDNRPTGQQANKLTGEDYVLLKFSKEERKILEEEVFGKILEKLSSVIARGESSSNAAI